MNNHEWARYYAKLGWHVLPCEPQSKDPLGKFVPHGFKNATTSLELIDLWWSKEPLANVAIATGQSDLHVVDVDVIDKYGNPKDGPAILAGLEKSHGAIARAVSQTTGSGGLQIFFQGAGLGSYKLAQDIDTRGVGGYVMVTPSLHPNGKYYLWNDGATPSPKNKPPALPGWVLEILRSKATQTSTSPALSLAIAPHERINPDQLKGFLSTRMLELLLTDGTTITDRSSADYSVTCALVRRGCTDSQIVDIFSRYPIGRGKAAERGEEYLLRTISAARALGHTINPYQFRNGHSNGHANGHGNGQLTARPHDEATAEEAETETEEEPLENPADGERDRDGLLVINLKYPKTKDYWAAFQNMQCQFALNDLDSQIELNGKPITDYDEAEIRNKIRDIGLVAGRVADALTHVAATNKYHPIKDYLNGLVWDGHDHLGEFLSHLEERPITDQAGRRVHILKTAFTRWLLGSCAKIFEQAQNFMLVWDSGQGAGKSTLARWLCPKPDYFMEGGFNPDSNDDKYQLCTRWMWEVAELQGTSSRSNREALKDFITKKWLTVRLPYGKRAITKPTLCSLIGTINDDGSGLLNDPTGNRRFVIVPLSRIDHGYTNCDRDQIWAQVMHLYRNGEPWRLTPEEEAAQRLVNAEYETESYLEGLFFEKFELDPAAPIMSSVEIMNHLEQAGLKGSQTLNLKELARVMTKNGIEKGRGRARSAGERRPSGYKGVRLKNVVDEIPI